MKNLCFTEGPLQFSEIVHKSLGNSIPPSPLFFFSLVLPYPLPAASPLHLLSILISILVSPSLFPLHGHRRRPKRWWRAAAAGGGSRRRRRPERSGSAGEQSAGAWARLARLRASSAGTRARARGSGGRSGRWASGAGGSGAGGSWRRASTAGAEAARPARVQALGGRSTGAQERAGVGSVRAARWRERATACAGRWCGRAAREALEQARASVSGHERASCGSCGRTGIGTEAGGGVDVGELGRGCQSWHAGPRKSECMEDRRSCRSSHAGARRLDSAKDGSGRNTQRWRRRDERRFGNRRRRNCCAGRRRAAHSGISAG
jgi:hypothetical protein